jgi:polyisoprenyl-phosphate glycosyltransferase
MKGGFKGVKDLVLSKEILMEDCKVDVPDISVVVPVYGCDGTLYELYERVAASVEKISAGFELILVDDCGPGQPWDLISDLAKSDSRVKGLKLSKNFGQHSAIMAGVEFSCGNWVVIMDCDLQDRPEEIPRLWAKAREGYDVVVGRRVDRKDGWLKRQFSCAFHWFFNYMTNQETDTAQSSFGIYSRKVVDIVKALSEQPRIFPLMVRWAGFKITPIDIAHGKRIEGKSGYTISRKISLAANAIVAYSNKPLKMFIQFGFLIAFTAFCYGIFLFIRYFFFDQIVAGWTSLMVSLYFLSGILLFGMGVLGIYISRIFDQVKGRPLYIVKHRTPVPGKNDSLL